MLQKATKTNYFVYKKEKKQNHFIGFMSFQHFNDQPLYSDVVVRPENNMTETQDYESFPIPQNVLQNGREEGYYPETSVAYFRFLWKEFEKEEGIYNFEFIEDIIKKAKEKGQTLVMRLLPHSTCERDDVPHWLKKLIPCPERPKGKRVKDSPTDPQFLKLFSRAVRAFGERFDNEPFLDAVDISLPGAWGEGYKLENYPQTDLDELFNAYIDVFKNTRLIGQIIRPELILKANEKTRVGWRGDGLGDPHHIYDYYPPNIAKMPDLWKTSPVAFESYWWLKQWQRNGWDIDEIISLTLKWHISQFNAKSFPAPNEWKEKIDYWVGKMGYHFVIDFFKFPETCQKGDEIELKLGIDNVGVAPIYNRIPLTLRLVREDESFEFETKIDIREWMPGKTVERFFIAVPEEVKKGKYQLQIGISDSDFGAIYFCTDAPENSGNYLVGDIEIV